MKKKLQPVVSDSFGASIYYCSESSDLKKKIAFVNRLIRNNSFIITTKENWELKEAILFLGQALDYEKDEELKLKYTILLKEYVDSVNWHYAEIKLGDVIQNISTGDAKVTLGWLDTLEIKRDKTSLRKVKELMNSSDPQVQERAREVFCQIAGIRSLDKESLKESRDSKKDRSRVGKLQEKAAREAKKLKNAPINTINDETMTIDIIAKGVYPANVLSNYHKVDPPFLVDGVECFSIEGFLQALKHRDIDLQKQYCVLNGAKAHYVGNHSKGCREWLKTQTLWWQGKEYKRDSEEYINLIKRAYKARFDASPEFRKALQDSLGYTLTHNNGYDDPTKTLLTVKEFLDCMESLRGLLR